VTQLYDVAANVPEGTAEWQAKRMLQNLLVECLGLASHLATKIFPGYELVVAPAGPKLTETAVEQNTHQPLLPPVLRSTLDNRSFPELQPGVRQSAQYARMSEHLYARFSDTSIPEFAKFLGSRFGTEWGGGAAVGRIWIEPALIVDKAGLTGRYDFKFDYQGFPNASVDPSDITSAIKSVIEKQLGLRFGRCQGSGDDTGDRTH
jgi:uncharacterized protein (TIGR03435 family)